MKALALTILAVTMNLSGGRPDAIRFTGTIVGVGYASAEIQGDYLHYVEGMANTHDAWHHEDHILWADIEETAFAFLKIEHRPTQDLARAD